MEVCDMMKTFYGFQWHVGLVFLFFLVQGAVCQGVTEPDNTSIIVGCTIGGFVFLLLVLLATYYFCKPSKRKQPEPPKKHRRGHKPHGNPYHYQSYPPYPKTSMPNKLTNSNGHIPAKFDDRRRDYVMPPSPVTKPAKTSQVFNYQSRIWMTGSQMLNLPPQQNPQPYTPPKPGQLKEWDRTTSDPVIYNYDINKRRPPVSPKEPKAVFEVSKASSGVKRSSSMGDPRQPTHIQPKQPMPVIPATEEETESHYSTVDRSKREKKYHSADNISETKISSLRVASELAIQGEPKQLDNKHIAVARWDGGHGVYAVIPSTSKRRAPVEDEESEGGESIGRRTLSGSQYGATAKEVTSEAFEFLNDYDLASAPRSPRSFRSFSYSTGE